MDSAIPETQSRRCGTAAVDGDVGRTPSAACTTSLLMAPLHIGAPRSAASTGPADISPTEDARTDRVKTGGGNPKLMKPKCCRRSRRAP